MADLKRPGLYIEEVLNPVRTPQSSGLAVAAFVGQHFRGPVTAQLLESWGDFVTHFGGFPPSGTTATHFPFAVYLFFANGGRRCYAARAVNADAVTATKTLQDRAGSPVNTLRLDALNDGAWGNNIRYSILDGSTGRFDLIIYYGGTTADKIVERFTDLSMSDSDARYIEKVVNSETNGSVYIVATDLDSATASPNDIPALATTVVLASGADGTAPGTTEFTAAVTAGTSPFDSVSETLLFNLPDTTTAAVINAAGTYAAAHNAGTGFVVVDCEAGDTPAEAVTYINTLTATGYAALYYPRLNVLDPTSNVSGATRACPPGGAILGKYADTDATRGVFKAPAGLTTRLSGVVSLERSLTPTDLDTLNVDNVNAIRSIEGSGIVVMGARTLATGRADMYVNVRRTLNYIKDGAVRSTQFALFENNDQDLWNQIVSVMNRFLGNLWSSGGLRGSTPAEAFYVLCDSSLNTPQVIEAGEVRYEIGVALQYPAEFVVLKIGQWEGGQSVAEAA